jgi:hypothetical protein
MITKDDLEKLRIRQYEEFNKRGTNSKPSPMFINGKFNPDNWAGGDNIIRHYFYEIETSDSWQRGYEVSSGYLIVNFYYYEDQAYAVIIHDDVDKYWENGQIEHHDVYYFSWYKHRGQTEVAKLNGHDITEEEYIRLLNLIEETGYRFLEERGK